MTKIAVKILFILLLVILLSSGWLIFRSRYTRAQDYDSNGNVMGIFDAIRRYQLRDSTPSSSSEVKNEVRDLNQVRSEVNREIAKKQEELLAKYKEEIGRYLGRYLEYLNRLKRQLSSYEVNIVGSINQQIDTEINWINTKKNELGQITTMDALRNFYREVRTHREQIRINSGTLRARLLERQLMTLEERLKKLENLLNKFESRLPEFEKRGFDIRDAQKVLKDLKKDLAEAFRKLEQAKRAASLPQEATRSGQPRSGQAYDLIGDIRGIVKRIITRLGEILPALRRQGLIISPTIGL